MAKNKVSYVKKTFAKRSIYSIGLVAAGLVLMILCFAFSVRKEGQGGLNVAAMGFCSLLLSLSGFWYGLLAFMEKDKNYALARISVIAGAVIVIVWLILIIMGFGG